MSNTPIPPPPDHIDDVLADLDEVFGDFLSPDDLERAREFVRDAVAAHPVGHLLGERVRSVTSVDRSAEKTKEHVGVGSAEAPRKAGRESK